MGRLQKMQQAGQMAIASRRPGLGTLVLLVPLVYPDWQAANYFSSSLVSSSASVDFVSLYISANPFDSLANTVVPAIVLFSIVMGVAVKQRRTSRDGRSYGMCCIG
jgi:Na+/H+-dicarboxylate symporter